MLKLHVLDCFLDSDLFCLNIMCFENWIARYFKMKTQKKNWFFFRNTQQQQQQHNHSAVYRSVSLGFFLFSCSYFYSILVTWSSNYKEKKEKYVAVWLNDFKTVVDILVLDLHELSFSKASRAKWKKKVYGFGLLFHFFRIFFSAMIH